ncbi:hypothetical protein [Mucilaginibacter lacusdianchii]|uniref:hypothetical protein n=1 Tax=Mucilaginibacter lacusdianchii TaxID=2684211 RepID=UPI00131DA422|nr:hypothetical protein [Mucilaginibacter sp. JXJ CY 39]
MNRYAGVILMVVGIIILIWSRLTYNDSEKLIDGNSIQNYASRQRSINWPPYVGGALVIAGIVVAVTGKKRKNI